MDEKDYINVLEALQDIPFNVGKNLLTDYLIGSMENKSVVQNKLDLLPSFGSLAYSKGELKELIDNLEKNGLIETTNVSFNQYWKVLKITRKGKEELKNPQLYKKKIGYKYKFKKTNISTKDERLFEEFSEFLEGFNKEQKKAITSNEDKLLCIAGAGTGKTSVLTKRIEFIVKYKSVKPEKILAVTFTRKARVQMREKLNELGVRGVQVETFNSLCEKYLVKNASKVYGKQVNLLSFGDKIKIIRNAIEAFDWTPHKVVNEYYSKKQKEYKTQEQLFNSFVSDVFLVIDDLKRQGKELYDFSLRTNEKNYDIAKLLYNSCKFVLKKMEELGLRDYTDQIVDVNNYLEDNPECTLNYDHILVDEYQDINDIQVELISKLKYNNLFVVGDPRQSIYGWRGSNINQILEFGEDSEVVTLTKNYRSNKHIVEASNKAIESLGMPDLESVFDGKKDMRVLEFDSAQVEHEFIAQRILSCNTNYGEIFVLVRTNREAQDISNFLKIRGIPHITKSDDREVESDSEKVTVATVHSIKGLESEMVFIAGCNNSNYPCKASDHPVLELVKLDNYDKEEEERRLFYVAMTRARNSLYLTYTGSMTRFISDKVLKVVNKPSDSSNSLRVFEKLKEWRKSKAQYEKVPGYVILKDSTLKEISEKLPEDEFSLQSITGIGPTKIYKYGEELLNVIRQGKNL